MPSKTKKYSNTSEMAVASKKRARTPDSNLDDTDIEDRPSSSPASKNSDPDDTEFKKPTKKRAKTEKSKDAKQAATIGAGPKYPPYLISSEGANPGTAKWWKEITAKDQFWEEFDKKVPKSVKMKRLLVSVTKGLESTEKVKNERVEKDDEVEESIAKKKSIAQWKIEAKKENKKTFSFSDSDLSSDDEIATPKTEKQKERERKEIERVIKKVPDTLKNAVTSKIKLLISVKKPTAIKVDKKTTEKKPNSGKTFDKKAGKGIEKREKIIEKNAEKNTKEDIEDELELEVIEKPVTDDVITIEKGDASVHVGAAGECVVEVDKDDESSAKTTVTDIAAEHTNEQPAVEEQPGISEKALEVGKVGSDGTVES